MVILMTMRTARLLPVFGLAALLANTDTERGIRALVEAYLDWVEQHPALAAFQFAMRHADFMQAVEPDLTRIQGEADDAATDWFRARMLSGELPNLTPDVLRAILYGPSAHFARQWTASQADVSLASAKKLLASAAWKALVGLRAPRP